MSESYTARAVLSATDKNFTKVFNTALGTASKLEKSFGGGLGMGVAMGIGQKLFSSISSGLSNIVRGTIAAGSGLESAMKQVQATMRVTDSTIGELDGKPVVIMDALREKAEELGKSTQFSAVQVGEAMNNMAMAGYDVQKIYDNIPTVLNLAAAGGLSLEYATQLVANGMAVMGDRCEGSAQMADMLAVTASSAYGSVAEFGEGLLVAGGQAKLCGLNLAETYTALGILGDAGMQGSEGGTQLRNALKNLYQPTDKAKKVLSQLGIETVDATGEMVPLQGVLTQLSEAMDGMTAGEKNDIMSKIFDTRTLRAGNALIEQSGERFTELYAKISACDGAAMEMANTVNDNLQGDLVKFSSAVEGLQDTIYKSLDGPMRLAVQTGTKGIGVLTSLADFLGKKFEEVKPYIDAIGDGIKTVLGIAEWDGETGLTSQLKKSWHEIEQSKAAAVVKEITDAFKELFGIWTGSTGASTALKRSWQEIAKNKALEEFKTKVKEVAEAVTTFLSDNKDTIIQFIHLLPTLAKGFVGLNVAKGVVGKLMPLGRGLQTVAGAFRDTAGAAASGVSFLKGGATTVFGKLGSVVSKEGGIFDKFGMRAQQALFKVETATGRFDKNPPKFWQMINSGKLGSAFGKFGTIASKSLGTLFTGVTQLSGLALKALAPGAMVGVILAGLGLVYNAFGDEINQILLMVQQQGPTIISTLASSIISQIPALIASGAELVGGLLETFTALAPSIVSAGAGIISALVTGVGSALPTLVPQAVMAVGTLAVSIIGQIPQLIASGVQLLVGLAQGIGNSLPMMITMAAQAVVSFIQGLGANLPAILTGGVQIIISLLSGILQSIPAIIEGAAQIVKSLVDTIINTDWLGVGMQIITMIKDGLVNGFTSFGDFITGLINGDNAGEEAGMTQAESVATGIEAGKPQVEEASTSLMDSIQTTASGIDLTSAGTGMAESLVTPYLSGIGELPGMTGEYTTQMLDTVTGTGDSITSSAEASSQKVNQILNTGLANMTATFNKGKTQASEAGKATGSNYAQGIANEQGNASNAGNILKNNAVNGMSGGYGSAYSHGANIGQGLADGIWSKLGAIRAAAAAAASEADKVIHKTAQIGSPSKITIRYGKWISEGLAKGISDGKFGVAKQAKTLTSGLLKTMRGSATKLKDVTSKMSDALKKFKEDLKDKASKDYEWLVGGLDKKLADMPKDYSKAYNSLLKAFKEGMSKEISRTISSVNSKFAKLAKTYETKYNDIIQGREAFKEKLQEHSLYTADDYGNVALKDFNAQKTMIVKYRNNINKLKKLLPDNMMDEILGMDMGSGMAYTNELLKKSSAWIKNYGKQYESLMNTGNSVANKYYSERLKNLQTSYLKELRKTYNNAQKEMAGIGKRVMQGLIDGMQSKKVALNSAGTSLANEVLKAIKKKFKIHSPSKAMRELGALAGEGWVLGIEDMASDSWKAMEEMVNIPKLASMPKLGAANFTSDENISESAEYVIVVQTQIDGKQVAQTIAPYSEAIAAKRTVRQNRKQGIN